MEIEEAKKAIIKHLDDVLTVKSTKWVEKDGEYIEVDAGYTEEELKFMQSYHDRDMKPYYKLKELLIELI